MFKQLSNYENIEVNVYYSKAKGVKIVIENEAELTEKYFKEVIEKGFDQ